MQQPSNALLVWYRANRRDLPWRQTKSPYCIWISEIMLQQTRVEAVREYYRRFLERFPTVETLADAPEGDVLKLWEGLGYYSRARNLHKAAQAIVQDYGGEFPRTYSQLLLLPGIGAYTAGAIASIAFGECVPAIDGNVYRVISRLRGVRMSISQPSVQRQIRELVQQMLPADSSGDFNQALMELGATVCLPGRPHCLECPWSADCSAYEEGDAELLPIHDAKPVPKQIDVAVCLLTDRNAILVRKRSERMLHGMYVFYLVEDEMSPQALCEHMAVQGLDARFKDALGEAKHVFTHRIWNMHLLHFELQASPADAVLAELNAKMVSLDGLRDLPFPTAMKAAKQEALKLLQP